MSGRVVFYAGKDLTIGHLMTMFGEGAYEYRLEIEDDVIVIVEP
jgi:hypothetical protein